MAAVRATSSRNRSVHPRQTHQTSSLTQAQAASQHGHIQATAAYVPNHVTYVSQPYPQKSYLSPDFPPTGIRGKSPICLQRSRIWFILRLCFSSVVRTVGLHVPLCHMSFLARPLASTPTETATAKKSLPCVNFLSIHNFNKGKMSSVDSELMSPPEPSSGPCGIPVSAPPARASPEGPSADQLFPAPSQHTKTSLGCCLL